jgi:predicted dehydrogenase
MDITFGLIGYGKIGERHAGHIRTHAQGRLAGAFDVRPDRMAAFAAACPGAKSFLSEAELLADPSIDIVSICTPNALHAPQAIRALEAGKHVLVEKPMALRTADCEAMIAAARHAGKSLFVVKQNRFNPPVQAVRQLIDEGRLGRIYTVALNCYWNRSASYYAQSDWKGKMALDGGTLYTQFSHFIDVLYYLLGDLHVLHARMDNVSHRGLIEFEDTGVVAFTLADHDAPGVLHYTTSAFDHNMEGSLTVFAEHATIRIGGKYLNQISYQATDGFDITLPADDRQPNRYGDYEGSMSNHDKVIDNVIRTLQGRDVIMTNAEDGMRSVAIIERIYQLANPVRHD